jgi:hypothetical protein
MEENTVILYFDAENLATYKKGYMAKAWAIQGTTNSNPFKVCIPLRCLDTQVEGSSAFWVRKVSE